MDDLGFAGARLSWFAWAITLYGGLTMVSNVPFYSFKDVNFRKSVPFIVAFLIVLGFVAVSSDPPKWLFGLFVTYGLSGYFVYAWRLVKGKPVQLIEPVAETPDRR